MGQRPAVPPTGRTRILIADDDRSFAEMLQIALASHDEFEVVGVVGNGAEAVARTAELKPALVLMDVTMPVLDGIEAARKMRLTIDPPTVILITGEDGASGDQRAYEAGAAAYLKKSQELVSVIDVVIAVSGVAIAN